MKRQSNGKSASARRRDRRGVVTIEDRAQRLGVSTSEYLVGLGQSNIQRYLEGAVFNSVIAILIVLNVVLIFIEFMLPPGEQLERVTRVNDGFTWIFVFELSVRFLVAPNKKIYFSNYWIDILACLPPLRIFRTLRVLRLLRLLRLARAVMILLNQSGWISDRFRRHFGSFGVLILTTIMLILCGTLASLSVEQMQGISFNRFLTEFWETTFLFMSGEVVNDLPSSHGGKFVSVLISVAGLVVFAVLVGTISASMTAYFTKKMEAKDIDISDLRNHLIICGWDRMGEIVLREIEAVSDIWRQGVVVVAETEVDIVAASGVKNARRLFHVRKDYTKVSVLEGVGAKHAKTAIVLADKGLGATLRDQDRDARTVLSALTLEKLNPSIFTCAELLNQQNATHLKIAGVEEVISRSSLTAGLLASSAVNEGVTPIVSDLMTHHEGNYLKKINLPDQHAGQTFLEVMEHFKREYDAMVIAVDTPDDDGRYRQHLNPQGQQVLSADDRITVVVKRDSTLCDLTL